MLATLALALAFAAPPQELPPTRVQGEATTVIAQFTPGERYRFRLGGEAGEYSEWERRDLAHFDGLATTIRVKAAKGRRSAKWASIARIDLYGAGEDGQRREKSIILSIDRTTQQVSPQLWRGKDLPRAPFNVDLPRGEPIDLKILTDTPGQLTIAFGETIFRIEDDFEIRSIGVLASGVDVRFDPFVLLHRLPASE
ncbi:hypothetical protein [Dokdonella fugitiva]|jgi:hypothetical protein|uniref:hypothetical protein n=1 Tax=Dokdonella fugitiva TaxID=328517 RepID=UPI0015FB68B8|nr:hypothetical protein [Dokdonella fugitiva]MBA8882311.1 hypothetical protein [Dokdonella fugitiva]